MGVDLLLFGWLGRRTSSILFEKPAAATAPLSSHHLCSFTGQIVGAPRYRWPPGDLQGRRPGVTSWTVPTVPYRDWREGEAGLGLRFLAGDVR